MAATAQQFNPAVFPAQFRADRPERIASSLSDTDLWTRQTVGLMCRHIREALKDPAVLKLAREVHAKWGLGPSHTRDCWAVFWWLKHHVRFRHDEAAVFALFNERDQVDFLISPSVLIRMRPMEGDCDDFTMLACALLLANGIGCEIVTIACDPSDPRRWSHVYLRAILPDGRRMAMDPTNGQHPGWEVPEGDTFRRQYWNMSGEPVDGPESSRDLRMHAYIPRRGFRGLAQSGEVPQENTIPTLGSPDVYVTPTGPGFWSSPLLSEIVKQGFTLGKIALTPTGGVVTQTPGGALTIANQATLPATVGGINTGSILVWLVLGVAGLFVIGSMGKK
jgi:hypothetical protein